MAGNTWLTVLTGLHTCLSLPSSPPPGEKTAIPSPLGNIQTIKRCRRSNSNDFRSPSRKRPATGDMGEVRYISLSLHVNCTMTTMVGWPRIMKFEVGLQVQ